MKNDDSLSNCNCFSYNENEHEEVCDAVSCNGNWTLQLQCALSR